MRVCRTGSRRLVWMAVDPLSLLHQCDQRRFTRASCVWTSPKALSLSWDVAGKGVSGHCIACC